MRNLLFKNITSRDRSQRVLSSSELIEQDGLRTNVSRHLVCRVLEVAKAGGFLPSPALYVLKKRDTEFNTEAFYCQIKGKMYLAAKDKLYLVSFIHSLRIQLRAIIPA